jgi:hypothetical protein
LIASGVTGTTYTNTGLAASTTYYYLVEALDSFGASAASPQASAETQPRRQLHRGSPSANRANGDSVFLKRHRLELERSNSSC